MKTTKKKSKAGKTKTLKIEITPKLQKLFDRAEELGISADKLVEECVLREISKHRIWTFEPTAQSKRNLAAAVARGIDQDELINTAIRMYLKR